MCGEAIVFSNKPKGVTLEGGVEYYLCACGRSKDGVFCDGSHKVTSCLPKKVVVEDTRQYHICMCKSSKNFPFCDGTHSQYSDKDVGGTVFGD
ncbi:CDGSH iron-sulfur domain-containing protein [Sulfurimonas sp.]|uniref:CDGSH iron-sulfur domain-containing protein n=1 Tax=Sulfurimonas sp. TaxID=2022749 RepID=UPI0025CB8710|nr:CDGSH iron-sulfur domain-containing protein [Sulfurimonas sp.]MDD5157843.1 CDGSH iron-sulfur domain-containing protein [Sulfurimonas sp.]